MTSPKTSRRSMLNLWTVCFTLSKPLHSTSFFPHSGVEPCYVSAFKNRPASQSQLYLQKRPLEPINFVDDIIRSRTKHQLTARQISDTSEKKDSTDPPLTDPNNMFHSCGIMPSCVTIIRRPEQLLEFLEEDDRLCVVNFRADWCRACRTFDFRLRHIIDVYGDHVDSRSGEMLQMGSVRFADVEYGANSHLCEVLDVKRMPRVDIYQVPKGVAGGSSKKICSISCGSNMHIVVKDAITQQLSLPGV